MVEFDLGGAEDAQEERKVGPPAEEEPDMDCECDGGEDGERVRLLPRPHALESRVGAPRGVPHAIQALVQTSCGLQES